MKKSKKKQRARKSCNYCENLRFVDKDGNPDNGPKSVPCPKCS